MKLLLSFSLAFLILFNPSGFCGVRLNGTTERILCTDPYTGNQANYSVCTTVFFDTDTTDDAITNHDAGVTGNSGWLLFRDNVGGVSGCTDCFTTIIGAVTTNYRIETATNSAVANTWYSICFTFDSGADELRFFINGVEDANSPDTTGSGTMIPAAAGLDLGDHPPAANFEMDGIIADHFAVDRTLTPSEAINWTGSRVKRMSLQYISASEAEGDYYPLDDFPEGTALNGGSLKSIALLKGTCVPVGTTATAEEYLSYP